MLYNGEHDCMKALWHVVPAQQHSAFHEILHAAILLPDMTESTDQVMMAASQHP